TSVPVAGSPVVGANGQPVMVDQNGVLIPIFLPGQQVTVTGVNSNGFNGAMSQVFHNQFPDYNVQLNVTIPIRNRSAQADNQRAIRRTLEVNRVTIADAKSGEAERETLIPGTLHGQVVGTDKLFFNSGQK